MKRAILFATALSLCLAAPAFAATLKTGGRIAGDTLTVGDVFADIPADDAVRFLAPAPAVGGTMTLTARDLTRISEAFGLGWTPDPAASVTLKRASSEIGAGEIADALTEALHGKLPPEERFEVELTQKDISFHVPEGGAASVQKVDVDVKNDTFRATVAAGGQSREVTGRIHELVQVPALHDTRRAGDVISADDIEMIDMRRADVTATMITDAASLVGRSPRRPLAALRPLSAGDVRAPIVVKKGDLVTMTLKNAAINLTAQGKALESGAAGDPVRVMNNASKQVVDAVVTGAQSVTVRPPQS